MTASTPRTFVNPDDDPAVTRWPQLRGMARGIEWLAYMLDSALPIPGTQLRIGLDPILGLLAPGAGDAAGGVLSLGVIFLALQYRVPLVVIARMVANIGIDALVGMIPVVGDLFDFGMKANQRNLKLLTRQTLSADPTRVPMSYWIAAFVLLLAAAACITLPLLLLGYLFKELFSR